MELRAIEDIATGHDITPALRPIAVVLRDSALSSYCSACFSPLPPHPYPPITAASPPNTHHVLSDSSTPLYCSPGCSSYDSPLHFSSAEAHLLSLFLQSPPSMWGDSSDLRLSLRLVTIFQKLPAKRGPPPPNSEFQTDTPEENDAFSERISGLMTNRQSLVFGTNRSNPGENSGDHEESDENNENLSERIRQGAKLMAKARRARLGEFVNPLEPSHFVFEEMTLCLVLTNAVEVQDKVGCILGVAIYGTEFSWINHSCSPNACYRFLMGRKDDECSPLRIDSAGKKESFYDLMVEGDVEKNGFGPRVIVRSIKDVRRGEEVTIAYVDLLQPKEMRQAELWSKYRFSCSCKRCNSSLPTYVDNVLQAFSDATHDNTISDPLDSEKERLMQSFDDAITDYLSFDDPISCCIKLENLLVYGDSLQPDGPKPPQKLKKPHLLHYLSLNSYTTLSSAYKVRSNDVSAVDYDVRIQNRVAFKMYKTSVAYSLLLAGGVLHLYEFEPALIATAANFLINAGESILDFARSPLWDPFLNSRLAHLDLSSVLIRKCDACGLANNLGPQWVSLDRNKEFEEIKGRLYSCIVDITMKIWCMLADESHFLKGIKNPVTFRRLEFPETSMGSEKSGLEAEECDENVRMNLISLGDHCLRYGSLLSSICYGSVCRLI